MGLYQKLETDMRTAMKGGDRARLSVLRMLLSAIKTAAINLNVKELSEPDMLQIIQKQAKQHRESIDQFEKGGRPDLAHKETEELGILESYMPKSLSEEELTAIIKAVVVETGASGKADLGKVMKIVMEKVKGRSEGKLVNQIASGLLK